TVRWRDRILLDEAEGRARILSAGAQTPFPPNTNAERQFVVTRAVAAEASARGDDRAAVGQWREMAGQLNPDDAEERKWHLLAQRGAETLENAIHDRRQFVEKQLQLAEEARRSGRPDQAIAILTKLFDEYRKYTDLADLFPTAPAQVPPSTGPPRLNDKDR